MLSCNENPKSHGAAWKMRRCMEKEARHQTEDYRGHPLPAAPSDAKHSRGALPSQTLPKCLIHKTLSKVKMIILNH